MTFKRFKHQKKSIIRDSKTGEEYVLKSARYPKRRRECLGGCQPGRGPRFHDSGEEAAYCEKLTILVRVHEIREYQTQKRFDLQDAHGNPCGWMVVDFVVTRPDGSWYCAEYKGKLFETLSDFRLKRALFSYCHPGIEYKTVTKKDLL